MRGHGSGGSRERDPTRLLSLSAIYGDRLAKRRAAEDAQGGARPVQRAKSVRAQRAALATPVTASPHSLSLTQGSSSSLCKPMLPHRDEPAPLHKLRRSRLHNSRTLSSMLLPPARAAAALS